METTASTKLESSTRLKEVFAAVRGLDIAAASDAARQTGLGVAEIVAYLDADDDVVLAALLQRLLAAKILERNAALTLFGEEALRLARALDQLGEFGLPADWTPERGLESSQAEALRKMLIAVIGDVRLVVVRLAEQLYKMRTAKASDGDAQRRLAIERARSTRRSRIVWACGR